MKEFHFHNFNDQCPQLPNPDWLLFKHTGKHAAVLTFFNCRWSYKIQNRCTFTKKKQYLWSVWTLNLLCWYWFSQNGSESISKSYIMHTNDNVFDIFKGSDDFVMLPVVMNSENDLPTFQFPSALRNKTSLYFSSLFCFFHSISSLFLVHFRCSHHVVFANNKNESRYFSQELVMKKDLQSQGDWATAY